MKRLPNNILEQINNLIVIAKDDGEVEYVSPSVKRILGFDPAELRGQNWWELTAMDGDRSIDLKKKILSGINHGGRAVNTSYEREIATKKGASKWILWNSYRNEDNYIVGIGYDITERKQTEVLLKKKNLELDRKNKDIVGSIEYAQRIQQAILPYDKKLKQLFSDAFIYYAPKDLVSGDFYWFYEAPGGMVYASAIDCTGHGVPGALMSVIANSLIRDIIIKRGIDSPAEILTLMDKELEEALSKEGQVASSDGMDIALCRFDRKDETLLYSGAFRPLIKVNENGLQEYKAQRYPIGFYHGVDKSFEDTEIELKKGDTFYMFSDGFIDQFGGEKGKKFNKKRFKKLLLSIREMDMEEQQSFLDYVFKNWRQDTEQVDDVLVMGIRV